MSAVEWTDAEREAVSRHESVLGTDDRPWGCQCGEAFRTSRAHTLHVRDATLDALAPHVAARERAAAARALREMADDLASVTHGRTSDALAHWPDHDRGIYELAIEEASGKIHDRADALEAGEDRG